MNTFSFSNFQGWTFSGDIEDNQLIPTTLTYRGKTKNYLTIEKVKYIWSSQVNQAPTLTTRQILGEELKCMRSRDKDWQGTAFEICKKTVGDRKIIYVVFGKHDQKVNFQFLGGCLTAVGAAAAIIGTGGAALLGGAIFAAGSSAFFDAKSKDVVDFDRKESLKQGAISAAIHVGTMGLGAIANISKTASIATHALFNGASNGLGYVAHEYCDQKQPTLKGVATAIASGAATGALTPLLDGHKVKSVLGKAIKDKSGVVLAQAATKGASCASVSTAINNAVNGRPIREGVVGNAAFSGATSAVFALPTAIEQKDRYEKVRASIEKHKAKMALSQLSTVPIAKEPPTQSEIKELIKKTTLPFGKEHDQLVEPTSPSSGLFESLIKACLLRVRISGKEDIHQILETNNITSEEVLALIDQLSLSLPVKKVFKLFISGLLDKSKKLSVNAFLDLVNGYLGHCKVSEDTRRRFKQLFLDFLDQKLQNKGSNLQNSPPPSNVNILPPQNPPPSNTNPPLPQNPPPSNVNSPPQNPSPPKWDTVTLVKTAVTVGAFTGFAYMVKGNRGCQTQVLDEPRINLVPNEQVVNQAAIELAIDEAVIEPVVNQAAIELAIDEAVIEPVVNQAAIEPAIDEATLAWREGVEGVAQLEGSPKMGGLDLRIEDVSIAQDAQVFTLTQLREEKKRIEEDIRQKEAEIENTDRPRDQFITNRKQLKSELNSLKKDLKVCEFAIREVQR